MATDGRVVHCFPARAPESRLPCRACLLIAQVLMDAVPGRRDFLLVSFRGHQRVGFARLSLVVLLGRSSGCR
eukprot:5120047-Amphidinium_carterae.1